jgi:hypothetical protein
MPPSRGCERVMARSELIVYGGAIGYGIGRDGAIAGAAIDRRAQRLC